MAVVMRGVVRRLEGGRPHVEVADLGVGYAFGPCELATSDEVAVGDRVFVAQVGDTPEDLAVIGLIDPPEPGSDTLPEVLAATPAGGSWAGVFRDASGVWGIGALPYSVVSHLVAGSGVSDAAKVVRADDARLSNARPPTAHGHALTDANITGVLPLAQLPSHSSTHDDRYFTEAESDARFPRFFQTAGLGPTSTWVRVALLNGGGASNGAHITLAVSGQGNFGTALRQTTTVHFGQRGAAGAYTFEAFSVGRSTSPWAWKVKPRADINDFSVELWALRPSYDSGAGVTVLSRWGPVAELYMDLATTTDPGGALQGSPMNLSDAVIRLVWNGSSYPARPSNVNHVDFFGPVDPGVLMGATDTWFNTAP